MNEDQAKTLLMKADALQTAGDKLAAAPLYVQAAAFTPFATFALIAGDSYAAAGQHADAVAAYDICLAEMPDHPDALDGKRLSTKELNPKKGFFARWFG